MNELQKQVDELIEEFGGYWDPFVMLAALVEEVGELSEALLNFEGPKGSGSIDDIREEVGDIMFALACIANVYKIDIFEALGTSIEKYKSRDKVRWKNSAT